MFNRIYVGYNKSVHRLRHKSLCACVCTGKCHSIFQGQEKWHQFIRHLLEEKTVIISKTFAK